jgi:hypothetical protein
MARPRKQQQETQDQVKYSMIVPQATDRAVREIAARTGRLTSQVVRDMIEDGVARDAGGGDAPGTITIQLREEIREALTVAAAGLNVSPAAVVQQLIARHLPDVVDEARSAEERLREKLGRREAEPPRRAADAGEVSGGG